MVDLKLAVERQLHGLETRIREQAEDPVPCPLQRFDQGLVRGPLDFSARWAAHIIEQCLDPVGDTLELLLEGGQHWHACWRIR